MRGRERERATAVYMCDSLWVIASSLGSQYARFQDIMNKHDAKVQKREKTAEEIVNNLVSVLKADAERKTNGN